MLNTALHIIFATWLCWVGGNLFLFLCGVFFAEHQSPCFDGFRIHIPEQYKTLVTEAELAAAISHEQGHRVRWHVWENLFRLLLFMPVSAHRRFEQELEADDYVKDSGSLAVFLVKTSIHPFDLYRAERLIARAKQCSQAVGNPSSGMLGSSTQ
jgi:hypothetical protein